MEVSHATRASGGLAPDRMEVDGATSSVVSTPLSELGPRSDVELLSSPPARFEVPDGFGGASHAPPPHTDDATRSTTKPKVRRPRKKKDADDTASSTGTGTEVKRERKTRKPRNAVAADPDNGPRKRQRVVVLEEDAMQPRQTTLTEHLASAPQRPPSTTPASVYHAASQQQQAPSVLYDAAGRPISAPATHLSTAPATPRPASSGLTYDPIRGVLHETTSSHRNPPPAATPPQQHYNRASASPAISSLIDPPSQTLPHSRGSALGAQQNSRPTPPLRPSTLSTPVSPALHQIHHLQQPLAPPSALAIKVEQQQQPHSSAAATEVSAAPSTQPTIEHPVAVHSSKPSPPSKAPSNASTPGPSGTSKPRTAPPLPSGSGLLDPASLAPKTLTSTLLSDQSSDMSAAYAQPGTGVHGVDIHLHIPLKPEGGNVVNIAREIIRKYGKDALNPRAAANRERQKQVAAAARAIERGEVGEGDDLMSVDDEEEGLGDSTAEGNEDEVASTAGDVKERKRRKRKDEEYDLDDDFIDDTERAWEEQAAVAEEGFFVYSGPIITEKERLERERAANPSNTTASGLPKRGRGSRGGRISSAPSTRGAHSNTGPIPTDPNTGLPVRGPGSRGGRGSRGGGTMRKPRITKAERAQLEKDKQEKERHLQSSNSPNNHHHISSNALGNGRTSTTDVAIGGGSGSVA